MRKNILPLSLTLILLVSLRFIISSKNKPVEQRVDTMASFTLKSTKGDLVSLDDYEDKKIILNFFTSWCPFCRDETKELHTLIEKRDDVDVIMINITPWEQSLKDVEAFEQELDVKLPVLLDKDGLFIHMFQIQGTPFNVFLSPDKEIKHIIPGGMDMEALELYLNQME